MKRLAIILSLAFSLLALPSNAAKKELVMIITDTAGVEQVIPVEKIDSVLFAEDVCQAVEGHAVVDLGLSVKWAYANLDLDGENLESAPYVENGNALYGWADPTGRQHSTSLNDYPAGVNWPPNNVSGTEYDIVKANWGGEWRLPTDEEMKELMNLCTWTWETVNEAHGYRVTGPNGNSIFLPASGWRYGNDADAQGVSGNYWSGTLSTDNNNSGRSISFNSLIKGNGYSQRMYGFSVRPVRP
ncbi:hypothetical protein [Sodaliphilus sp.]|uniref:hypothetical protein n=1 Tax=Sodaliphilus sp. TaxID=2815818 RepID=UPI00388FE267